MKLTYESRVYVRETRGCDVGKVAPFLCCPIK